MVAPQYQKRTKKPLKDDLNILWDAMKSISFFLGIYLFFSGWLYLYYYFTQLGVPFDLLSTELVSYYHYGFLCLTRGFTPFLVVSIIIALYIIYYNRARVRYLYASVLSLLIIFFIGSYYSVKHTAIERANALFAEADKTRTIYFDFKQNFLSSLITDSLEQKLLHDSDAVLFRRDPENGALNLLLFNNNLELLLIYENSDYYYVFRRPQDGRLIVNIFTIRKEDINYATLLSI